MSIIYLETVILIFIYHPTTTITTTVISASAALPPWVGRGWEVPDGGAGVQVTVEVQPKLAGYLEFFVIAKAPILPPRVMDLDACANAAYNAVGRDLTGARSLVGTIISPPAPLIVLASAQACEDICSLVVPVWKRSSSDSHHSSSSTHIGPANPPDDDCDSSDDSAGSSRMHHAHNFQPVAGFQHYPLEPVSSSAQCMSMQCMKRYAQVGACLHAG